METFEFLCEVRVIVEARDEHRAESIVREELEGVAFEIESVTLVK
jgi:hypothetical protein